MRSGIGAVARRPHTVCVGVLAPPHGARIRYAYEIAPTDLFRTQFLSLMPLVKGRYAYEMALNDPSRTHLVHVKGLVMYKCPGNVPFICIAVTCQFWTPGTKDWTRCEKVWTLRGNV